MSKISELEDGTPLVSSDYLIAVRSGGNVKVRLTSLNIDQITLGDNEMIRLGNSQDLTMVHTSTQSIINQAGIGDLLLQKAGTTKASITANGLEFPDNSKAIFGAGSDLQIYHDPAGPSSFISDQGAGDLILRGSNQIRFQDATGVEHYAIFNENGAVQLYHDNGLTLATSASGISVTGTVTADGLTVQSGVADVRAGNIGPSSNASVNIGRADTSIASGNPLGYVQFLGSDNTAGSLTPHAYIGAIASSTHSAGSNPTEIVFGTTATSSETILERLKISDNGDISFYSSDGLSQALFWDASAESLGIGTSSPALAGGGTGLHINATSYPELKFTNSTTGAGAGDGSLLQSSGNNFSIQNREAGSITFSTSNTVRATLDASGNFLAGTTDVAIWNNNADSAADNGSNLRTDGRAGFSSYQVTAGSNATVNINRTGSDGDAIRVFKSGTLVGSIGTVDGELTIGNGDTGLYFWGDSDKILPFNTTTNTIRDAAIDLGRTSTRFKDLHLSGNASMGSLSPGIVTISTGSYFIGNATNGYRFNNAADTSNLMILKDSGELLVGKTTSDLGVTAGIELNGQYDVGYFTRSAEKALVVNRLSTDGTIAEFRQDGAPVGSIGTNSGYMVIGSPVGTDAHLLIGNGLIHPADPAGNAKDNAIDIGGSGNRFKNLYLSGGVYLGGTGAANHLDSYEEGTWIATIADAQTGGNTGSTHTGRYRKVGTLVTVFCSLTNIDTTGLTATNVLYVQGLPFTSNANNNTQGTAKVDQVTIEAGRTYIYSQIAGNDTWLNFQSSGDSIGESNVDAQHITSGASDIQFTIQYIV